MTCIFSQVVNHQPEVEPDLFKIGEKLIFLNFGKFSNEYVVARLESGRSFEEISNVLKSDPKETLQKIPVVGQVVKLLKNLASLLMHTSLNSREGTRRTFSFFKPFVHLCKDSHARRLKVNNKY